MRVSTVYYPAANGPKYLQQLCKHFAHKAEVRFTDTEGHTVLGEGVAHLAADENGLSVRIEAPEAKAVIQTRYVVDVHLANFAFREDFSGLTWVIDPA
jgi:hypothetical protein